VPQKPFLGRVAICLESGGDSLAGDSHQRSAAESHDRPYKTCEGATAEPDVGQLGGADCTSDRHSQTQAGQQIPEGHFDGSSASTQSGVGDRAYLV
jgi:hypothetical protein